MGKRIAQTKQLALEQLEFYPANPRRGDVAAIRASLEATGQYRAIVVRSDTLEVLAGNHTLAAMRELGYEKALCHLVDVDDESARRIVLADNRTAELATYDEQALADLLGEMDELAGSGWEQAAVDELLQSLNADEAGRDTEPSEPPAKPRTKPGDLWLLGEHRLLCGDATDADSRGRVYGEAKVGCVLTDPPYGIDLDTDYSRINGSARSAPGMRGRGRKHRVVKGDDAPFDAAPFVEPFAHVKEQFWFGADYYRRSLSPQDLDGSWLVWDKRTEETDTVIGSGFELIWSRQPHKRDVLRFYWCGAFGGPEARERMHPTQKPVALLEEILTRWAPDGCIVADPFAGSGSTLIACENLGRRCYAMEIDPGYCDVIVDRFERHTGKQATLDG